MKAKHSILKKVAAVPFPAVPRKGQTEQAEFVLKLLATILFVVVMIGGIMAISQFRVQVNSNIGKRLSIDYGENLLSASCLTEKKGLFNETMLDKQLDYSLSHPEDKDGISCINAAAVTSAEIKTADREWFFGDPALRSIEALTDFQFPAALNASDGKIVPAKLFALVLKSDVCDNGYGGLNCYNCLDRSKCVSAGCKWEGEICKY